MEQNQLDLSPEQPDSDFIALAQYAERAYLDYAVSVVKGRALPDVADGQKPVQRRILYSMNEMGLGPTVKPVKSARVVGDVLGKFHPHGDQSAYDTMVRMAQDFSLRYPLVDGQGNFGSRDGDGAAAMRYTEARLTPISKLLLDEIDQGTVEFGPNYDGSLQEPLLLPARLPFSLLNGASGIAVGMATEIPSHNLREVAAACVALIKDAKLSDEDLQTLIPGPDFPGGAQIISSATDIAEIYRTGRGSLKTRARSTFEDLARGQWQLVITELPPNTSAAKVLAEIEELTNPKVKVGKKSLTPEQQNLKSFVLGMLDSVRDEAGKQAAVRLVFEPKTSKIDRDEFLTMLLANTSLEQSASVNLVAIGRDGRPTQKSLRQLVLEWIDFRMVTVRRRTQHRMDKVLDRIHVLEGRLLVFLNIDKVIRVIRESDEPRADLMQTFKLTERQAEDILEIRLRQLARLESIKIEQELKELRAEQEELAKILGDEKLLRKLIIKEIEADAKQYGDERRTLIEQAQRASVEQKIVDEPVTVIVSQKGWLRARQGHGHDVSLFTFKTGDAYAASFECRTVDTLIALANDGRAYSVPVSALPSARGDGTPITTLIELQPGTRIVQTIAGTAQTKLLFATRGGFGLIASLGDLISRQRAGKQFLALEEGDEPLPLHVIATGATRIWCVTSKQRVLSFELSEVRVQTGGGKGITLMDVDSKEPLAVVIAYGAAGLIASGTSRGKTSEQSLSTAQLAEYEGKRARKGKQWGGSIKVPSFRAA